MAAVLAPVTGQSVAVGHVPLRSEVGSLAVHRPGSVRGMVMACHGMIWSVSLQASSFFHFFLASSFCCQNLPKGVAVYIVLRNKA